MARRRSSVPEFVVYLVKFASIAACAARETWAGVGKSGSPAPKSTTSTPCAFSLMASVVTLIVGEIAILPARAESIVLGPQSFTCEFLAPEVRFDGLGHQTVDRAAQRD